MNTPVNTSHPMPSSPAMPPAPQATSFSTSPKAMKKRKLPIQYVIGGIVLLFLLVGGAAAMYLASRSQEIRQQASGGGQCVGGPGSGSNAACAGASGAGPGQQVGCGGRSQAACQALAACGCSWLAEQAPAPVPAPGQPAPAPSTCASGWTCNGHCADAATVTNFNNTWTDGHARWLWEAAGNTAACGGNPSTPKTTTGGGTGGTSSGTCDSSSTAKYCVGQAFGAKLNYSGPYLCVCKPTTGNSCWCDPNDSSLPVLNTGCPSGDVCVASGDTNPTGTIPDSQTCTVSGKSGTCYKFATSNQVGTGGSTCSNPKNLDGCTTAGQCINGHQCQPQAGVCSQYLQLGSTTCTSSSTSPTQSNDPCNSLNGDPQHCGLSGTCTYASGICYTIPKNVSTGQDCNPNTGATSACGGTQVGDCAPTQSRQCLLQVANFTHPYIYGACQTDPKCSPTYSACTATTNRPNACSCKTDSECSSGYCNGLTCAPSISSNSNNIGSLSCTGTSVTNCGGRFTGDCAYNEARFCSAGQYSNCEKSDPCNPAPFTGNSLVPLGPNGCVKGDTLVGSYCISASCGCGGDPTARFVYSKDNPSNRYCDSYAPGSSKIASGVPACNTGATSNQPGPTTACTTFGEQSCTNNRLYICMAPAGWKDVTSTMSQSYLDAHCPGAQAGGQAVPNSAGGATCSSPGTYSPCGGVFANDCPSGQRRYCTTDHTWGGCIAAGQGSVPACNSSTGGNQFISLNSCTSTSTLNAASCSGKADGYQPTSSCTCHVVSSDTTGGICACVPNAPGSANAGLENIVCRRDNPNVCPGVSYSNAGYNASIGGDCTTDSTGKMTCTNCSAYDKCAPTSQVGGSCAGKIRLSYGETSHGGFVGCSGAQNCFCGSAYNQTSVGQAYTSADGNVQCFADVGNDSCGAGAAPVSSPAPASQPAPAQPSQPGTPGPVCLNISISNKTPKKGDTVTFTCGQVAGVNHYEFRVKLPDGSIQSLSATANVSSSLSITQSGEYKAQCRICTGTDVSTCQAYESL